MKVAKIRPPGYGSMSAKFPALQPNPMSNHPLVCSDNIWGYLSSPFMTNPGNQIKERTIRSIFQPRSDCALRCQPVSTIGHILSADPGLALMT